MDEVENSLGCSHYKRKCQLFAPCCKKAYTCRFCHDETEDHKLNRRDVAEVVCLSCSKKQEVTNTCVKCNTVFGKYFCEVCRLYDDEDKGQYHCKGCGICRVGGQGKFFHCPRCDMCFPKRLKGKHKCVENASRSNCPVCLEDLHTSRVPAHVPGCGHLIHRNCFENLIDSGNYACPVCSVSMVNMNSIWTHLDQEVASTPMPPDYADHVVGILCRDCHKESTVRFHVVGLKCGSCGSYNTCRSGNSSTALPEAEGQGGSGRSAGGQLRSLFLDLVDHLGRLQESRYRSMRTF